MARHLQWPTPESRDVEVQQQQQFTHDTSNAYDVWHVNKHAWPCNNACIQPHPMQGMNNIHPQSSKELQSGQAGLVALAAMPGMHPC
eukprot:361875-Chlamydomonas_euryale.AAC.5